MSYHFKVSYNETKIKGRKEPIKLLTQDEKGSWKEVTGDSFRQDFNHEPPSTEKAENLGLKQNEIISKEEMDCLMKLKEYIESEILN